MKAFILTSQKDLLWVDSMCIGRAVVDPNYCLNLPAKWEGGFL